MYGTTTQRGAGSPEGVQPGSWSRHGDHQHGVQFYSQDSFLLEALSEYIGNALRAGDAAVVVATETHRNSLLQWLTSQGLDIATLVEQGRLVLTDAAQLLGTTSRTLSRQLRDQGTSFRTLSDQLRSQAAMKYLRETTMTNEHIASALGFVDEANFRHAFQRWTGKTPSEYRRARRP